MKIKGFKLRKALRKLIILERPFNGEILKALTENEFDSQQELANHLGVSQPHAALYLKELKREGYIHEKPTYKGYKNLEKEYEVDINEINRVSQIAKELAEGCVEI